MSNYLPPSSKQKNWLAAVLIQAMLSPIFFFIMLNVMWRKNFGSISRHFDFIMMSVRHLLIEYETSSIRAYKSALVEHGIYNEVINTFSYALLTSLVIGIPITFIIASKLPKRSRDVVVSGGRVVEHRSRVRKREGELLLHPYLPLSKHQATGNIFTFGAHGSGKTTLIMSILRQLTAKTNTKIIIFDEKKEYTEHFYEKNDVLIAPWDSRSALWDIGSDLKTASDFRTFAAQVIPVDEKNSVWGEGARELLFGIMTVIAKRDLLSWELLSRYLSKDSTEWELDFTEVYPPALKFITGAHQTTASYLSTLAAAVGWVHDLANMHRAGKPISLREWVAKTTNSSQKIIIQSHAKYATSMKNYANLIIQTVSTELLSQGDSEDTQFWLIIDELGNLPKNETLPRWLSLGRSKGARTMAGTQSISQIRKVYGELEAETIISLFKNLVVFQCGNLGQTAEVASNSLGQTIFERPSAININSGKSEFSWHRFTENTVSKSDITGLSQNKNGVAGFAKVTGDDNIYKLIWPFNRSQKIAQASVIHTNSVQPPESKTENRLKRKGGLG